MVLQLTVADVMTKPVRTVTPDTPLQQAVQIISDHHVSGLPVVDAEGRLIGELTEQDLMGNDSHSCGKDLPLPKAASQLHERGTQRLFVLDGKKCPIGVITRGDVVRALASHQKS